MRIWRLGTREQVRALTGHKGDVLAVALSDEHPVAISAASLPGEPARVWPTDGRSTCLSTLKHGTHWVTSTSCAADLIVTGCSDTKLRLWSLTALPVVPCVCVLDHGGSAGRFDTLNYIAARLSTWF